MIIKPKDHHFYRPEIEALLDLFTVYQKLELSSEEKSRTTFMIADDRKRGVYGGALLYQRPIVELNDKIKKILSALCANKRKVWTGALCFRIEEEEPFSALDKLELYQNFYQNLFKQFIRFRKQEKTNFLILSLCPRDFIRTKVYGQWPYLLEIHPKDATGSLFHGILDIKHTKPATSQPKRTPGFLSNLRRESL